MDTGSLHVVRVGLAAMKGTRHLPTERLVLDDHGPVGDRDLCLVDVARRGVLRTVQHPELVAVEVRVDGQRLVATLPGGARVAGPAGPTGETLTCDYWGRPVPLDLLDGPHADAFSQMLGREVRLARAPRGGVVFGESVSIVTTASIARLGEAAGHPDLLAESVRFRATLVVATDAAYEEDGWIGRELTVGTARLRIGGPIPRCAVIDIDPATGVRNGRLLRALGASRPANRAGEPLFGVYASVIRAGTVP